MIRSNLLKGYISLLRKYRKPASERVSEHEKRLLEACILSEHNSLTLLKSRPEGLSEEEAQERLAEFGPNEIAQEAELGFFRALLHRFKNPLVIQLLVICAVSLAMDDYRSATVVGLMILLSVFLSYFYETRSSNAVKKLHQMVAATCAVIRGGKEVEIANHQVVPGDIVVLAAGSIIPADLRIISAKDFFVSQAALTGESMPIEKAPVSGPSPDKGEKNPLHMQNACFMGSNVLSGSARAVVVNTGGRTYFGSIASALTSGRTQTSFDKGIHGFTWLMIRFMIVMVSVTFLIVGLTKGTWTDALLFGLAIAVGLTPEMLPMIITVNLSKGAIAMSRKKVIVKSLASIQNIGAMDILCTDKTGTLTQDRVVLEKYVDVTNRQNDDVLRYAYMNSYYQTGLRNLLDRAILNHTELDVEKSSQKIDEIPFDFKRRRMSVVIRHEDQHVLVCKGAVEEVFAASSHYQIDDEIYPLIDLLRKELLEEYKTLSADGYRVLAVAYREFPKDKEVFSIPDEQDLVLLGYIAFFDPPKETAASAIAALINSGVNVKILTGDNELVTRKVCRDVGIDATRIITGNELSELSGDRLAEAVDSVNIFARLTPNQKEEIITLLQARGHVVGFLGDGINDAPAMKTADVGISVDSAVDIAKESADIILLEKSLLVLEDGIIEGRKVFGNIIKYVKMGASSNFGNMFSVVGGSYFLPFLPMAPIQILANNLLYDFSQTGIPTDNVDAEYIQKPRKWNIDYIKKFMLFIGPISSLFDYATYFLMLYFFDCRNFSLPGTSEAMKHHYESLFHTGWFVESLLTQTLIVHIIRTNRIPFIQSRASLPMTLTTGIVIAIGAYLPYSPIAGSLGLTPLPLSYWFWITGFLAAYSTLTHGVKTWFNKKMGVE